jgi:RND superfamily putative drug exporter
VSSFLYRVTAWSVRRRLVVLFSWILIAAAVTTTGLLSGGTLSNSFSIPGTQSQQVADLLARRLPALTGGQAQVVFATPHADITKGDYQKAVSRSVADLAAVRGVASATDPFQTMAVSRDRHVALALVQFNGQPSDVPGSTLSAVSAAVESARAAGVTVAFTGSVYPGYQPAPSELPELAGVITALIILVITLGSLLAAGLPILTALTGVVISVTGLLAVSSVVNLSSSASAVTLLLGLSCGIDYGLFILSRHRSQLLGGTDVLESIALAVGTAGSAVVFAGATVIVTLASIAALGIPFLAAMGLAAAGGVLIAVLLAITLLPALLGFAGKRAATFIPLPALHRRAERIARRAVGDSEASMGGSWAKSVTRFRVPVLIIGAAILILAALPLGTIRLGLPTAATQPEGSTARQAYELTSAGFGAGFNGPLLITAENVDSPKQATPMIAAFSKLPDVAGASLAVVKNGVAIINVIPDSGPNSQKTIDLVTAIRNDHAHLQRLGDSTSVLVGGLTASNIDVSKKIGDATPLFLLVIASLSFILLTFAFRTLLVPLKSIIGFLLSVTASMGVLVAVFQWGWGADLFGVTPGPIISFQPVFMLAIIFGLSANYELFVVSRIKESFSRTGDARAAVIHGTAQSARVVTAAALIMATIFSSLLLGSDPTLKAVGFSFALGVLVDAFVVRLTLVPAFMSIIGAKIWWHPKWFAHVPDADIEGARLRHRIQESEGLRHV